MLTDVEFWKVIDTLNWDSDYDYERCRKYLMKEFTRQRCKELNKVFRTKKSSLYDRVFSWEETNNKSCNLADDSFDDLLSHIIGLGADEYNAVMTNPQLAVDRAMAAYGSKARFKESFSYAWPDGFDYELSNHYCQKNRAAELVAEIDLIAAEGFTDVYEALSAVRKLLCDIAIGNFEKANNFVPSMLDDFLNRRDSVIGTWKQLEWLRNQSDLEWPIKNLFSNVQEYIL